ncbi:hypothetical protein ACQP2E_00795 [Actinoplanes sp. CA-015351]|uniref:hypothetical protein n=1 Tax=Actinoplanes sp. CA-015351 TaxID=3239897 RepID=UPI003D96E077
MTVGASAAETVILERVTESDADPVEPQQVAALWRWLPAAVGLVAFVVILLVTGTPVLDVLRYAGYVAYAVVLPGTLVYRLLRRTPHTLVEDLAFGAAVGLAMELVAWAVYSYLDLRSLIWTWPLLVVAVFAAVPRLRRHWSPSGYRIVPLGWSWAVTGVVVFFTGYIWATFFAQNPIMPTGEDTLQFIDLPYQLSLAGEAKNHFPMHLPQVAGEALPYHWFAFVHAAMISMIGHVDLSVVTMRLLVPGIGALIALVTAVAGWRITGRAYAGAAAAALFLVVGEFQFTEVFSTTLGVQVAWIVWPSLSMTYSWALLVALVAVIGDALRRKDDDSPVPRLGLPGAFALAAILAFASSAAKASSLPVTLAGLALAGVMVLVTTRRIPWTLVGMGVVVALAQLFCTAVIFQFQSYGLGVHPFGGLIPLWNDPEGERSFLAQGAVIAGVSIAWILSMQIRLAGIIPLAWLKRGRLEPVQWFLLGGALAGPALFMLLGTFNASWFYRASLPFGLILSAWGFAMVWDRAKLSRRAVLVLGAGALVFAEALLIAVLLFAPRQPRGESYSGVLPILWWAGVLSALALVIGFAWRPAARRWPGLAGRGGVVLLAAILLTGTPGLIMEARRSQLAPNGGGNTTVPMPESRVEAARWVRANSDPNDIIATNVHCSHDVPLAKCRDARSFWLSAYSERSVLVEGWTFAPRLAGVPDARWKFWDSKKLAFNDDAIYKPSAKALNRMRDRYHVRYLVVDRRLRAEGTKLSQLATLRFDNGRMAVYELR